MFGPTDLDLAMDQALIPEFVTQSHPNNEQPRGEFAKKEDEDK